MTYDKPRQHWLARFFLDRPVTAVLLTILLLTGIGYGSWALSVGTASTAGSGQIVKDQQNAANRENANVTLTAAYQQIVADQEQIKILGAVKNPSVEQTTNLTGAHLNCTQDVAAYNKSAASILIKPFIPAGYPAQISGSNCDADATPLTDLG